MQDKEFDKLFNSKLGDFEVEPSPMVWDNIVDELHGQKRKRAVISYLSIAASIIILVSVGLFLFNQTESSFVKPVKQNKVAVKIDKPSTVDNPTKNSAASAPVMVNRPINAVAAVSKHYVKTVSKPIINAIATQVTAPVNAPVIAAPLPINQPLLSAAAVPLTTAPAMIVPDKATLFNTADVDDRQAPEIVTTTTDTIKTTVKKRGIHSVGGLINAIIAKVDKREDKLIEFTEDQEDGSTVTGLNLGLIKIKKQ